MKIQVERDALAEAVAWTARGLQARPAVPVLAGMRLQADAELSLASFDYDVSAQASIPVASEEEGTALVSGRLLAEITRSLPARPVQISTDGSRATLTCGDCTSSVNDRIARARRNLTFQQHLETRHLRVDRVLTGAA